MARTSVDDSLARRTRWLTDLSEALEQAQEVVWQIGMAYSEDTLDLLTRLTSAQREVRSLQIGTHFPQKRAHPNWSDTHLWNRASEDVV